MISVSELNVDVILLDTKECFEIFLNVLLLFLIFKIVKSILLKLSELDKEFMNL